MSTRIDYYGDPDAPAANSVRPAASAFVVKGDAVLLIERSDNGNWSMPGGVHESGETLSRTAVRETFEETGVSIRITGLVGIFTDPGHVTLYTSDGEVRQEFSIVYNAEYLRGDPTPSDEASRVAWVTLDQLDALPMDRSQRQRLDWARTHPDQIWIDPAGD